MLMDRLACMLLVVALGQVAFCAPSEAARPSETLRAQVPAAGKAIYLLAIYGQLSPVGTYFCYESEFHQIWTTEVITLSVDGSSVYAYNPPYTAIVTGTWEYSPTAREIEFTGFRWVTVTIELPNRLWASQYLPGSGFEIGVDCNRREAALN